MKESPAVIKARKFRAKVEEGENPVFKKISRQEAGEIIKQGGEVHALYYESNIMPSGWPHWEAAEMVFRGGEYEGDPYFWKYVGGCTALFGSSGGSVDFWKPVFGREADEIIWARKLRAQYKVYLVEYGRIYGEQMGALFDMNKNQGWGGWYEWFTDEEVPERVRKARARYRAAKKEYAEKAEGLLRQMEEEQAWIDSQLEAGYQPPA